jgi:RNA polymerase sigma-70 factor (ECF subfamily)
VAPERLPGDLEIIEGLRAGRREAAVALYELVMPAICATLTQVLGRADRDHDDLCQLALLRIVDTVVDSRFAGRCILRTWANVVTSRLVLDELRRRRRERRVLAPEEAAGAEVPAPAFGNPERRLLEQQDLSELRRALGRLRPAQAEAVLLFDVLGHDLREVAELTGMSVAAAQSTVVRGRQELRRLLQRTPGADHD